ncbi:SurA domain protein [Thermovibrio ammonificans HB-1]|uniref:SurA domain protein n=1 Tax=Thermovibrio ammonificans (strain DSM 15698 / JCM 12110 / HB-1) TaxID=648996 RepID=E8T1Y9_THEA1|nr:peptidylprolyl isomerase [Thermovibrio ammonificans]ADU96884.1 SurA domain protein [Thermovibrio ammonificans HB-1]
MKRFLLLLCLFLLPLTSQAKVVDYIAAVVNGQPILYSDVVRFARENHINNLRVALDRLIEREILLTQARSEGISVSDKELKTALLELARKNGFKSLEEFKKALEKEGIPFSRVEESVKDQLIVAKLIARDVRSKVKVSDIELDKLCLKVEGKPEREVYYIYTKNRADAEKAMELLANGVPFQKVARELSQDPMTAQNGGYLGYVSPGMLVKPLDRVVWSIKPGSYRLVRLKDGYYIVYVKGEKRGQCNREKLREQLFAQRFQKALKEYIENLKRSASVKVYM